MTTNRTPAPAPLAPGEKLGPYEIRRLIHRSAITTVYRAFSSDLNIDVALKTLHFPPEDQDKAIKIQHRFFHEIQASTTLNHPNITHIYDFGQEGRLYFIAMEYVEGTSLRDVLSERRGGLPQDRVLQIFRQVTDALAYAHSKQITHQDIRPGNILLEDTGRPVLGDFGLMRVVSDDEETTAKFSPRAPLYMSPEQAAGNEITARADIYALGILLYEMVTGDVPFKGHSAASILVQHLQQVPRPPSELAVGLDMRIEVAILRALAKNPEDRFASPRSMMESIEREINTQEYDTVNLTREATSDFRQKVEKSRVVRAPAPVDEPPESPMNRRMTTLMIGVIVVVLVIVGVLLVTQIGVG
jgi:serine/threonine protein kinase